MKQNGTLIGYRDYEPFGAPLSAKQDKTRLGFIDKEQDKESSLADHGVRKYDYETGRFISCDALWGKYLGWSPYQYSGNDPIVILDFNGKVWERSTDPTQYAREQQRIDWMNMTSDGRAMVNAIDRSDIVVKFNFDRIDKTIDGRKVNSQIVHDGKLIWFSADRECSLTTVTMQFDDGNSDLIDNTAHEFWHTLSIILNPCGYLKKAYEDNQLSHDQQRSEGGCDDDPGAIKMGKSIGNATRIEIDIQEGIKASLNI